MRFVLAFYIYVRIITDKNMYVSMCVYVSKLSFFALYVSEFRVNGLREKNLLHSRNDEKREK